MSFCLFVLLGRGCVTEKPATDVTKLFFIRHAEKAEDGTRNPPLSDEGIARAKRWAKMLKSEGIQAIYSTDYKRTRSTAQPIADKLSLTVQMYDPTDLKVEKFLETIAGQNVLIVGHGNTTPMFANAVLGIEKYPQIDHDVYGNLYVVEYWKGGRTSSYVISEE